MPCLRISSINLLISSKSLSNNFKVPFLSNGYYFVIVGRFSASSATSSNLSTFYVRIPSLTCLNYNSFKLSRLIIPSLFCYLFFYSTFSMVGLKSSRLSSPSKPESVIIEESEPDLDDFSDSLSSSSLNSLT
jgi:hypothetical protein